MIESIEIRPFGANDIIPTLELYPFAFPDEDLVPLVKDLSVCEDVYAFVALCADRVVGHVALAECALDASPTKIALLGPLAVHPDFSKRGIGSALARQGVDAMRQYGLSAVMLLGSPAYYGRFGFSTEHTVRPPLPLRDDWVDAWQSVWLVDDARPTKRTPLIVPAPWRDPAYWR